jgi:hypothetical protein
MMRILRPQRPCFVSEGPRISSKGQTGSGRGRKSGLSTMRAELKVQAGVSIKEIGSATLQGVVRRVSCISLRDSRCAQHTCLTLTFSFKPSASFVQLLFDTCLCFYRRQNEDRLVFKQGPPAAGPGEVAAYAAVFDGHGGNACSDWLEQNFYKYVSKAWQGLSLPGKKV